MPRRVVPAGAGTGSSSAQAAARAAAMPEGAVRGAAGVPLHPERNRSVHVARHRTTDRHRVLARVRTAAAAPGGPSRGAAVYEGSTWFSSAPESVGPQT
jgi:hypothetical protein